MNDDRLGPSHDSDHRFCDRLGCGDREDLPGPVDKKSLKKIIICISLAYGFICYFLIALDLKTRYRFAPPLMDPNDLISFIFLVTLGMACVFIIFFELQSKK